MSFSPWRLWTPSLFQEGGQEAATYEPYDEAAPPLTQPSQFGQSGTYSPQHHCRKHSLLEHHDLTVSLHQLSGKSQTVNSQDDFQAEDHSYEHDCSGERLRVAVQFPAECQNKPNI